MNKISGEAMLVRWAESHSGGATITLLLPDPADLEPFKALTLAKGKTAGQRLAYAIVEISDDEQAAEEKPKGGELCKWACILSSDPLFAQWMQNVKELGPKWTPADFIRAQCMVESRVELDHNQNAAYLFRNEIMKPFHEWKETR